MGSSMLPAQVEIAIAADPATARASAKSSVRSASYDSPALRASKHDSWGGAAEDDAEETHCTANGHWRDVGAPTRCP